MEISAISYDTPSSVPFLRFIVQVNWYTLHLSFSSSFYFVSLLQVLQHPLRTKSYKQQQPSLPTLLSNPPHLSSLNNPFLFSLFLPYSLFPKYIFHSFPSLKPVCAPFILFFFHSSFCISHNYKLVSLLRNNQTITLGTNQLQFNPRQLLLYHLHKEFTYQQ